MMAKIKLVHVDTLSCETILRIAPNGDLLILAQCGDVREPAPKNREYIFRSTDGGETWSDGVSVYPEDGNAVYATEMWVHDGVIDLFLVTHNGYFGNAKTFVVRSTDNGLTFEKIFDYEWEGLLFIRSATRLSNGKIAMAFQRYRFSPSENVVNFGEKGAKMNFDVKKAENGLYIYDEFPGKCTESNSVDFYMEMNGKRYWKWTEPTIAELGDGTIVMLFRVDGEGYLYESRSTDGGISWSEPVKTSLKNPGNKPKLIRMNDGRIALINTFNSRYGFKGRKPLSIWISSDNMKSWDYKKDVVDFDGWLSYPDGVESEDGKHILFAFEFNRHDTYFVDHTI
ncbi:MAG: exo-alpha-sialidase [Christensenellales bacterium]